MKQQTSDALETVKENSLRASNEAFEILAALKDGDIKLSEASEMSNAIGKINAANSNVIKSELIMFARNKDSEQIKRIEV
tara:strand:- start:516 stop:755 length:240 start_codon:yes stop_codon:yes gene_type:complete